MEEGVGRVRVATDAHAAAATMSTGVEPPVSVVVGKDNSNNNLQQRESSGKISQKESSSASSSSSEELKKIAALNNNKNSTERKLKGRIYDKSRVPSIRIRRVGKAPISPHKHILNTTTHDNPATTAVPATATAESAVKVVDLKVPSKHDEKWNLMFKTLCEYKRKYDSTIVAQYNDEFPQLGRWVHYQRVEYWAFHSTGKGKITPDRIQRLNEIGFVWDPISGQWDTMFERLEQFKAANGHCRVPKGYKDDRELANWVRNQRLEYAHLQRNQKHRMPPERLQRLNAIGFTWSHPITATTTTTPRRRSRPTTTKKLVNKNQKQQPTQKNHHDADAELKNAEHVQVCPV